MSMKVKLWGIRGSLPTPHPPDVLASRFRSLMRDFFTSGFTKPDQIEDYTSKLPNYKLGGFGGNTSCVEVFTDKSQIIIDGGSGIRRLGERMMGGPCGKGQGKVHILMTHFHWDHLIGLPFFIPLFIPGNQIHFYAVQPELETCIKSIFQKPFFPVPFDRLASKIVFHKIEPRVPLQLDEFSVTPYMLDHPDPCWGYKVENSGAAFSYCVDTEGTRISRRDLGPDLALYQNVDLMIFDAQYTLVEATEKIDWGHSAAPIGLDLALREGVNRIIFAHHDPAATDEKIAETMRMTAEYHETHKHYSKSLGRPTGSIEWSFAIEGDVIEVEPTIRVARDAKVEHDVQQAGTQTKVIGAIDENFDFRQIEFSPGEKLTLDLEGVTMINSGGIHRWVTWIKSVAKSVTVVFSRCSRVVVDQMNMVDGFIPENAIVESVMVPYFCEKCDDTRSVLIHEGQHFETATTFSVERLKLPAASTCEICGGNLERDIVEGKYFKFLKRKSDRR